MLRSRREGLKKFSICDGKCQAALWCGDGELQPALQVLWSFWPQAQETFCTRVQALMVGSACECYSMGPVFLPLKMEFLWPFAVQLCMGLNRGWPKNKLGHMGRVRSWWGPFLSVSQLWPLDGMNFLCFSKVLWGRGLATGHPILSSNPDSPAALVMWTWA